MNGFLDNLVNSLRWFQTVAAPLIVGLFFGGVIYSFMPNLIGYKLSVTIASVGLISGVVVTVLRIAKNKGPASFYSGKNGK